MLAKRKSRFLTTSVSVAALTVGMAFAQPAQKASAQVAGVGSTAAANLYTGFGANYGGGGSSVCASGTVPDGNDFCATDIPYTPADGFTITRVAGLRIEAPNNGVASGLSQDAFCAIIRGDVTTYTDADGNDQTITVVYRLPGSGTGYIVNSACGADGSQVPGAIGVGSSGAVVSTVASTPGAIGYAEQANLNGIPSALGSPIIGDTYAIYDPNNDAATELIGAIQGNPDLVSALGYGLLGLIGPQGSQCPPRGIFTLICPPQ